MEFSKIWYDGTTVQLKWEEPLNDGVDKHEWPCSETPSPRLIAGLQAFIPFVLTLLDLPESWASDMTVRSLSLKRDEDTGRGFQVTFMRKCAKAKNRPLIATTPYLSEAPETVTDPKGYLDAVTLKLIAQAEEAAEAYFGGERGEQTKLELSDNTKAFDERAAAAEVAVTRNPRRNGTKGTKGPKTTEPPVPGDVLNPDSTVPPMTDAQLRNLLLTVDRDVPIDAVAVWTASERTKAQAWGIARQKELAGALTDAHVPTEPECVMKSATLPLSAESWTAPKPPRAADVTAVKTDEEKAPRPTTHRHLH